MTADLDGPLDDFKDRLGEIKLTLALVESANKKKGALSTTRPGVDINSISAVTGNVTSAMSLIFLASSFEEFVREEVGECGKYLSQKYSSLSDQDRHNVRNSYWSVCSSKAGFIRGVLTKTKPKAIDIISIAKLKSILDGASGFVVLDDPSLMDGSILGHHRNNYKSHVFDEVAARIGVKSLIENAAEIGRVKSYFGVSTKSDAGRLLKAKLDSFYDKRNEIVHSLNTASGYGVDTLYDYIEMFDCASDGIKSALSSHIAKW